MKFLRYNDIYYHIDYVVGFRDREVKVIFNSEDGLESNFENVFIDLNEDDYEDARIQFEDELPFFRIEREE